MHKKWKKGDYGYVTLSDGTRKRIEFGRFPPAGRKKYDSTIGYLKYYLTHLHKKY